MGRLRRIVFWVWMAWVPLISLGEGTSVVWAASPQLKAQVLLRKGQSYYRTQEYPKALAALTQAIELDPTLASAFHLRGSIHHALNQTREACRDWKLACELDLSCQGWNFGLYQKLCQRMESSTNPTLPVP